MIPALIILIAVAAAVAWGVACRRWPKVATEDVVAAPTVLVVDDEPTVRLTTSRLLQRAGFDVRQAASADEALDVVRAANGSVSAMLSDVVMPGANGFELAGAVRKLSPATAILLFTAYTPAAIKRHNLRGESDVALLQKPLERDQLVDAVTSAIAARR